MCHCGARFKFLVLSFKQRSVSWDNLLILDPQRHIHKRWQQLKFMRILFLFTFLTTTVKAISCTCSFGVDEKSIKERIAKADFIVYATALPDKNLSKIKMLGDSTVFVEEIVFEVNKVLKGNPTSSIKLRQSRNHCDAYFRIGEIYLIFAYHNSETKILETGACESLSEWTKPNTRDPDRPMTKEKELLRFAKQLIVDGDRRRKF